MEQKKIDELKKLMAFGLLIADRINNSPDFNIIIRTMSSNDVVELLAHCVCAFEQEYTKYNMIKEFKEPQTTKLLEQAYSEYMEFKKSEQGKTL